MTKVQQQKLIRSLLLALCVSSVIGLLHTAALFERNEWMMFDWLVQQQRADSTAPDDIAIILIDDASLQAMDPVVGRWPWPRSILADVIDYLTLGTPKAILFDILFSERQPSPLTAGQNGIDQDQRLIEATQNSGITYHAAQLIQDKEDEVNKSLTGNPFPEYIRQHDALPLSVPVTSDVDTGAVSNNYLIPFEGLYQAAKGLGIVSVDKDRDGILRRTSLLHSYQGYDYPALSIASLINSETPPYYDTEHARLQIGTVTLPYDQGSYLINPYNHFNTYSMSGILSSIAMLQQGNVDQLIVDPSEFTNKTIFIGASAIGLHDLKTTALADKAPGVFIHASVLGNILTGDILQPTTIYYTGLSIVLLALLTTFGVLYSRSIVTQLVIPITLLLCFCTLAYIVFQHHLVLEVIPPSVTILLSWACAYTYLLFTEEKEKHKIRKMFSQYVSPAALSVMVDQYENYVTAGVGTKETVSILFSDIRGFTVMSENNTAETVVEILNYYLSRMTEVIHLHHGTVDKFIGDAIMAIWGAPIKSGTHASDAVNAAIEMRKKMQEVNAWLAARQLPQLEIGIGINTGEVILGSIGSEQKADYTVIGDNVNLASRLEGITKTYGCSIIISESTQQLIAQDIPCLLVDMVRVKGKQRPIRIYTPLTPETSSLTPGQQAAIRAAELSQAAFTHYIRQEWEQAMMLYHDLPHARLREIYLHRCREFQQHEPEPGWDGAYTMTSK